MAATERGRRTAPAPQSGAVRTSPSGESFASPLGALVAAALALPGILPSTAVAESAPDHGIFAAKYMDYRDWQPGARRMVVRSPSFYAMTPISDAWSVEGSLTHDSMTGASPLYHNTLSGASKAGVNDYREAGDLKLTRHFDHLAVGLGAAVSSEHDYLSRAGSLDVRYSSDDRNTTLALGVGGAADYINTPEGAANRQQKHTLESLIGITQALSSTTLVQSNVTYTRGHGYYSDPYKLLDVRPHERRIVAWQTSIQQFVPPADAVLRMSYRWLRDSFGSDSSAIEASWRQSLPAGFALTPSMRYYAQSAAAFYHDPPFPIGFAFGASYTADTRLSAFGALTTGLRVDRQFADGWSADFKFEIYRQRAGLRVGAPGSPGLEPFSARWIQFGISKTL